MNFSILPNADSITYLKEGYDSLYFSFPNLDSNIVSLDDPQYQDKVVIVQLMGSWCPNCKDETEFLTDVSGRKIRVMILK